MILEPTKVRHAGTLSQEEIVLTVLRDGDLGSYFVMRGTPTGKSRVSNKVSYPVWLPDQGVEAGDTVRICTRKGESGWNKDQNEFRYYLGRESAIWDGNRAVIVIDARNWAWIRT